MEHRKAAKSKAIDQAPNIPEPTFIKTSLLLVAFAIAFILVAVPIFSNNSLLAATPQVATLTKAPQARQLVIASHGRLFVYDVDTQQEEPLLINSTLGEIPRGAVFYSVFPSATPERTLYCALRGDLDHGDRDFVVEIDYIARTIVSKQAIKLPSTSFTHEVIRISDNRVLCADTGSGALNVLTFPDFKLEKRLTHFTRENHLNSLSPVSNNANLVWGTFFNQQAPSFVALFDIDTGKVVQRIDKIGYQAHSWLEWKDNLRVYLSSKEAMLCVYDLKAMKRKVIYTSKLQTQKPMFLKGLAVVNDVAYFGESEMADRKGRETVQVTLVAVDLNTKQVLFSRKNVGSVGLINTISLLGERDSTGRAHVGFPTSTVLPNFLPCPAYPAALDTIRFSKRSGYAYGRFPKGVHIAQLPYVADSVKGLQSDVDALVQKYGWTLRPDVNNYFVLLVTQHGVPTDQSNFGPFKPVPGRLDLAPHIRKLFTQLGCVIGRTRLMMIKPGEEVKIHFDRTNHVNQHTGRADISSGYWGRRFRIHVPIKTHAGVTFTVDKSEIHMEPGRVYIFDNSKMHKVTNLSNETRIHLVIDTVGGPRFFKALQHARTLPEAKSSKKPEIGQLPSTPTDMYLYEEWVDSPVHVPMPVSSINKYFQGQIAPQLTNKKQEASEILTTFTKRWSVAPNTVDVWYDLLYPAICSNITLANGYSLYEALEPIARMALYRCVMQEDEVGSLCYARHT